MGDNKTEDKINEIVSNLSEKQKNILEKLSKKFKDPTKIDKKGADEIIKTLGLDKKIIKKIKNKIGTKKEKISKFPPNDRCFCESGKKYKKCCFLK